MKTSTGFLLSYYKYGDHDAVLHCFTLENGFQSFFAKGIYTSKNKKKSYLLPLNEILVTFKEKNKTELISITKIELNANLDISVYEEIKTSSIILFVADFLHQILRNEQQQEKIYFSIKNFIEQVYSRKHQSHLLFLIKFLKILGISPLVEEGKNLNYETGKFTNVISFECFSENISDVWKLVLQDSQYETDIPASARKEFLDSIMRYYQQHFPEFKKPKSLEILSQLFE